MDADEQTRFVLQEMRRYRKVDDIIYKLCEKTGGKWPETAAFVHQVIADNPEKIEQGRQPLIVVICAVMIVAGVAGVLGSLALSISGVIIIVGAIPYAGNMAMFVAGLAALGGGVRGMIDIVMKPEPDGEK